MADKLFVKHILRKVFLEDWGLKLLALAITLALWLGVTGLSTHSRRSLAVPLNTIVANDAIVTNTLRQEVEVVLSGDKRLLDQLNRSDISASINLSEVPMGEWVMPLSPDTVFANNLPQGIVLEEVRPNNMAVKLDSVGEKDVIVRAETTGTIAPGYEIYQTTLIPARIRVRGPASLVRLLDYVQTDKIDLANKKEDFTTRQLAVTSPDPKVAVLNTVADVVIKIGEKRIERPFSLPVQGEPGKSATFVVFGPRTILQNAKAEEFKVEMYLDDNGELKPRVILPKDLEDLAEVRGLKLK